jgi:hypothetical protein
VTDHVPVFDDERGRLVPVEFDGLPFTPRRVFAVVAPPGGATRGEHLVTCRELVVLLTGTAEVQVTGPGGATTGHPLDTAGSTLLLEVGEWVVYRLSDAASVLVLADAEYTP